MIDVMALTGCTQPRPAEREGTAMLLHEALARCRQHDAERAAREYALARRLTAGRRWARLAGFAARRAARARAGVAVDVCERDATVVRT